MAEGQIYEMGTYNSYPRLRSTDPVQNRFTKIDKTPSEANRKVDSMYGIRLVNLFSSTYPRALPKYHKPLKSVVRSYRIRGTSTAICMPMPMSIADQVGHVRYDFLARLDEGSFWHAMILIVWNDA